MYAQLGFCAPVLTVFNGITTLLLDMNSTFMFGEDRFDEGFDYSEYYKQIGGTLPCELVNETINNVLEYLGNRYPQEKYRHNFPSVKNAINATSIHTIPSEETEKIIRTFAFYEHGHIPEEYIAALKKLEKTYRLAAVIDIWAPSDMWLETFNQLGVDTLFSALSFSSDHGIVKPSPKPFEMVMKKMNVLPTECIVIGDSVRRDLGGAIAANIECILVNGSKDNRALGSFTNLIEVSNVAC